MGAKLRDLLAGREHRGVVGVVVPLGRAAQRHGKLATSIGRLRGHVAVVEHQALQIEALYAVKTRIGKIDGGCRNARRGVRHHKRRKVHRGQINRRCYLHARFVHEVQRNARKRGAQLTQREHVFVDGDALSVEAAHVLLAAELIAHAVKGNRDVGFVRARIASVLQHKLISHARLAMRHLHRGRLRIGSRNGRHRRLLRSVGGNGGAVSTNAYVSRRVALNIVSVHIVKRIEMRRRVNAIVVGSCARTCADAVRVRLTAQVDDHSRRARGIALKRCQTDAHHAQHG